MRKKRCSRCEELKPLSAFHKSARTKDGYRCACKDCRHKKYLEQRPQKLAYKHHYYYENRDAILGYMRNYYRGHQEWIKKKARQWEEAHPEQKRAQTRRASRLYYARKQDAVTGPIDETAIYERDGFACVYCGSRERLELDHIVPLALGGPHRGDNLVVACRHCNASKGPKPLIAWLLEKTT